MELQIATVEQIVEELKSRKVPFMLIMGQSPHDLQEIGKDCTFNLHEENMPNPWMTYTIMEQMTSIQRTVCKELEKAGHTAENWPGDSR